MFGALTKIIALTVAGAFSLGLMTAAVGKFAPDSITQAGKRHAQEWIGWDKEACQEDPIGCSESKTATYRRVLSKLDENIGALKRQQNDLTESRGEHAKKIEISHLLLEDGRKQYQKVGGMVQKISFAGGTYDSRDELSNQLMVMASEKKALQETVAEEGRVLKKVEEAIQGHLAQRSALQAALATMNAKSNLIALTANTSELQALQKTLDDSLKLTMGFEDGQVPGIATLDEILARLDEHREKGPQLDPAFATWLNGGEEPTATVAGGSDSEM